MKSKILRRGALIFLVIVMALLMVLSVVNAEDGSAVVIDNSITVFEAEATYTAGDGVDVLFACTKGNETFNVLVVDKATGTLKFENATGAYETLCHKDGNPIVLSGETPKKIAAIYNDTKGTVRYFVGGKLACYGEEHAEANDIPVSSAFVSATGEENVTTLESSLTEVNVYNVHNSGTAEIVGLQPHMADNSIRFVAGVDMLWYTAVGFDVEVYENGDCRGIKTLEETHVFSGVLADGKYVYASEYGYEYFSVFAITDIDFYEGNEYYVIVKPYTSVGETRYYGAAKKVNMSADGYSFDETSQGLEFTSNGNGTCYVSGIGTCGDTDIVIPAKSPAGHKVTGIGAEAFCDCDSLKSITIPDSVTSIGAKAFYDCDSLTGITMGNGVKTVGEKAFMYCIGLKSVLIPDNVTTISTGAFMACYNLEEVTLGAGLTRINNDVFACCFNLSRADIPVGVSSIGDWAFFECDLLSTVNYGGTDAEWNEINFGHRWDDTRGEYTVYCSNDKTVHKHTFGEWSATGEPCEMIHECACGVTQTKYEHGDSTSEWTFTSEGVINKCDNCGNAIDEYVKGDVILRLDFDDTVSSELSAYPYFSLVSDSSNTYSEGDGRTVWAVNNATWIDYDKRAFEDLKYYSITFDLMFDGDPSSNLRDISVISFVPGYKNGAQVGSSVGWNWQIKYIPLLGKLATVSVNGQSIPYSTPEDVPEDKMPTDSNSVDFPTNTWVTVDIVYDVDAKTTHIFVGDKSIGTIYTSVDYGDPDFGDAFSLRFIDFGRTGLKFDNLMIQSMASGVVEGTEACVHDDLVSYDAKDPSCTQIGWEDYVACSNCDYTTCVEIPALGHDEVDCEAKAPTCTEVGWNSYVACSRCKYSTCVEIPALGHDEVKHSAKAATCTESGWNAYVTCSRCDYTTYAEIPALGHTEVIDAAKAATCTETGLTEGKHCSACGEVFVSQDTVAALCRSKGLSGKAPRCGTSP